MGLKKRLKKAKTETTQQKFQLKIEELEDLMANLPEKPPFVREVSTGLYETAQEDGKVKFRHHELVEIYSALKKGCWVNHETKEELVERLETYMIDVAIHNDFNPKQVTK